MRKFFVFSTSISLIFGSLIGQEEGCIAPFLPAEPVALAPVDVVSSTLSNQWEIQIFEEEINRRGGIAQRTSGFFNPLFDSRYRKEWLNNLQVLGRKTTDDGRRTELELFLQKAFRSGTVVEGGMVIEKEFNPLFALTAPWKRINRTQLYFTIDQPLLRRFLYSPETVAEQVAYLEWRAVKYDFVQAVANNVRNSVSFYWDLVAAKKIWDARKDSVKRLEKLSRAVERLIKKEQVAESEIFQQYAEIEREKRRRTQAAQDVFTTLNQVLFAMGQPAYPTSKILPELTLAEFPDVQGEEIPYESITAIALQNRWDLLAATLRIKERSLELRSARNALLPNLDVRGGGAMLNSTVGEDARPLFGSLESNLPQTNWFAELRFSVPIFRDDAKGAVRQFRAEKWQAFLNEEELSQQIQTELSTALRNQYSLRKQLEEAGEAVRWYETTLNAELRRLKEGYSTLFVVIDFQNRLTQATIEQILTQREYAQNLVDLLFLTGLLARPGECFDKVWVSDDLSLNPVLNLLQSRGDDA